MRIKTDLNSAITVVFSDPESISHHTTNDEHSQQGVDTTALYAFTAKMLGDFATLRDRCVTHVSLCILIGRKKSCIRQAHVSYATVL